MGVRLTLEVHVCSCRSCEVQACCCLPEAKGTVKLREDRNDASSSQNELGREQSDKQRGVGVKEPRAEGFAGERHRSRGMGTGVQASSGHTQPVPRGEVVVDTAVPSSRMARHRQGEEPRELKTGVLPAH